MLRHFITDTEEEGSRGLGEGKTGEEVEDTCRRRELLGG